MSDFRGFKDSFLKSNSQSTTNSHSGSGIDSPPQSELSKYKSLVIPIINVKPEDNLLSKSSDIKKQLSQSFGGASSSYGGHSSSYGGINKPHSRKNSIAVKSNGGSDAEDNDDEAEGNERKRRDGINEKIQELLTLIPDKFFQVGKDPKEGNGEDEQVTMKSSGTKDGKPNKGQILTSSVEYIQHLQNVIDQNNRKETELLIRLQGLSPQSNIKLTPTSAEIALGEIGVGTESDEYFKSVLLKALSRPGRRASLG
jgi:hypothetical protein